MHAAFSFSPATCNYLEKMSSLFLQLVLGRLYVTFWIPLLFNDNGIQILVTPLNLLGDKNVHKIAEVLRISSVNVTGQSVTDELFKVSFQVIGY